MAIVQTVSFYDFCEAFRRMDRHDQYSTSALHLIFDDLEEYSESTGEPIELDVIALCVELSEDTPENIAQNYNMDISGCDDLSDITEKVCDRIDYESRVIGVTDDGKIVYVNF